MSAAPVALSLSKGPPEPVEGRRKVRIGGASGFWGDSSVGAPQLVERGDVQYLVFDYLAELTMSILAAARAKNPQLGYATDFVEVTLRSVLKDAIAKRIRIVSNAGGVNPQACADAIHALAAELGAAVRIAVVTGDDVLDLVPQLRNEGVSELQDGRPLPDRLLTANAYLGALPIRRALDEGAQIVVTGRCVDSAVTLGVLMHEFDWPPDDHDRLAQGSLAGHIIECGCQATGGLHTDWEQVPDWPHIGYPVLECREDGSFVVGKPPGTGGLVNGAVVAEQMLYEIGDPQRYVLPDVVCDFTQVTLRQAGEDRVEVRGARGGAPTSTYKVSATYAEGFRCTAQLTIVGIDAASKARRTGEAILARTRELFTARGLADYHRSRIEVLGSEASNFGAQARTAGAREAVLHLAVMHPQKAALELFAREIAAAGTSWSPGTTGAGGRPSPSPCIRQFAFLIDKTRVRPQVRIGERDIAVEIPEGGQVRGFDRLSPNGQEKGEEQRASVSVHPEPVEGPRQSVHPEPVGPPRPSVHPELVEGQPLRTSPEHLRAVPLIRLAYARSGDKGDISNIGVIARKPDWLPLLREQLTDARVAAWLSHLVKGRVARYELPGIHALNFVCTEALDGGGMASLRNDPLGKGMAQILLAMPVEVDPRRWPDAAALDDSSCDSRATMPG